MGLNACVEFFRWYPAGLQSAKLRGSTRVLTKTGNVQTVWTSYCSFSAFIEGEKEGNPKMYHGVDLNLQLCFPFAKLSALQFLVLAESPELRGAAARQFLGFDQQL